MCALWTQTLSVIERKLGYVANPFAKCSTSPTPQPTQTYLASTVEPSAQSSQCLEQSRILVALDSIERTHAGKSTHPLCVKLNNTAQINHVEWIFNILHEEERGKSNELFLEIRHTHSKIYYTSLESTLDRMYWGRVTPP